MNGLTTAPTSEPPCLLLDAKRAAKALSVSPRTLWTLTKGGQIPAVRLGRRVLYDPEDLQAFIARHKHPARIHKGATRAELSRGGRR